MSPSAVQSVLSVCFKTCIKQAQRTLSRASEEALQCDSARLGIYEQLPENSLLIWTQSLSDLTKTDNEFVFKNNPGAKKPDVSTCFPK